MGWDLERADWRTFRVDRMTPRTPTGPRFAQRPLPGDDVAAWIAARFTATRWPCTGEAVLHADAATITRWAGGQAVVEPLAAGRCRVVAGSWSWQGLAAWLGLFGCDVDVVGPAALRDATRELADRYARAAAPDSDRPPHPTGA